MLLFVCCFVRFLLYWQRSFYKESKKFLMNKSVFKITFLCQILLIRFKIDIYIYVICVSGKSSVSWQEVKASYWMNRMNWSPNEDMLINFCLRVIRVEEEEGEGEEVDNDDFFPVCNLCYFFVWSCVSFNNILFYFRLVLLITAWLFER